MGGRPLPQILTEPEHLKHIDALIIFRNNIVPKLHIIFSVHKPDRSYIRIKNTTQILYLRWGGGGGGGQGVEVQCKE